MNLAIFFLIMQSMLASANICMFPLIINTCSKSVNVIHRYASEGPLLGILGYTDEDVVSNDFVGDSR